MPTVRLPRDCYAADLIHALGDAGALDGGDGLLIVHFPERSFIHTAAIAFLCAWGRQETSRGREIRLQGDAETLGYLARMDLHQHLGLPYEKGRRHSEEGRFLPLRLIASADDTGPVLTAIRRLLERQFDGAETFLRSACWAVSEILDNILMHADSAEPGAVCAQYFPKMHRLDVGVYDVGRGVRASLGESMPLWSHGHAVTTALRRGVTRDLEIGQGNGLAGTREIALGNGGDFRLWTGDVVYRLRDGKELGFETIPEVPGTGVMFSLDTRRPVDLSQTWMAKFEGPSYLIASDEFDLMSDLSSPAPGLTGVGPPPQKVLRLVEESGNTTTRESARRLRRSVLDLLERSSATVALDFAGVEVASSSFFDELLGRLIKEIGLETFQSRVVVQNLSATDEGLANVAIIQRLEQEKGNP